MINSLDECLNEFLDDLKRIENLGHLIDSVRNLGGENEPGSNAEEPFEIAAMYLRKQVQDHGTDIPILSGTLVLYLVGRFENFVRRSFEALCDQFASKCSRFDDLPEKMRDNLISYTATVISRPARYGYDAIEVQAFIYNLSQNLQAENGIGPINSMCLSVTEGNMRSDTLAALFKRVGISSLWLEVAKQAQLKAYFQIENDSHVEREARAFLDNMITVRNAIAHPGTIPTFPDTQRVMDYVEFLKIFGSVLIEVCKVKISVYDPVS